MLTRRTSGAAITPSSFRFKSAVIAVVGFAEVGGGGPDEAEFVKNEDPEVVDADTGVSVVFGNDAEDADADADADADDDAVTDADTDADPDADEEDGESASSLICSLLADEPNLILSEIRGLAVSSPMVFINNWSVNRSDVCNGVVDVIRMVYVVGLMLLFSYC